MRYSTKDILKGALNPFAIRPVFQKQLVIFGTGSIAEMADDYFQNESDYQVVAFTQEQEELTKSYKSFTVYQFDGIETMFPPDQYDMFVAIGINSVRERIYQECKEKGYKLASLVSRYAYIGRNVIIGENCFIQEYNNLQYGVEIGNNTFLWAKNHIGHHSKIGKHCFLASGITLSGYNKIGDYTFIGSGATTKDNIKIGKNCLVGLGVRVCQDIPDNKKFTTLQTYPDEIPTYKDI